MVKQARSGRVAGKRILVTGGAGGLGAACARRLSDEGARVIIADLLDDAGERLAQEIGGDYRRLDVSSEEEWSALSLGLKRDFGGLDGLVNNAGIASSKAGEDVERIALEDLHRIFAVNVTGATFHVGELTASGLPEASADAVLCTDSIQFPDHPADAYREIRRVLKPGGRVVLTCWEPVTPGDERLSPRLRHVDLAAGLAGAGFTGIAVADQPAWRDRERALWEAAIAIDPGDDPALQSFRAEAARSLDHFDLIRENGAWKVQNITWSSRTTGCEG